MNIKQLTYTSGEKGWDIERISGIPTEKEKKIFTSIIAQRQHDAVLYAYDFSDGVSVFSRSVPYGADALGRSRFYAHGYVFSGKECDEIFSRFSEILSINYFAEKEEAPIKQIKDIISEFPSRLRAEKETLVKLISAVYETILNDKLLEIYVNTSEKELFIKVLINTVMEYIPSPLRKFISFASAPGGSIHKITVTDVFSSYADIKYDFSSGEFEGLGTRYLKFAALLLSERKDSVLNELEETIGGKYFEDISSAKNILTEKTDNIVFRSESERKITADEVPDLFKKLTERRQFNNSDDIKYLINLFKVAKKDKKLFLSFSDESVATIYKETQSEELRKTIEDFLVSKHRESESPFNELLSVSDIDIKLFSALANKFIKNGHSEFLNECVCYMIKNPSFVLFAENCSEVCSERIYSELSKKILESENVSGLLTALYTTGGKDVYLLAEKALIANGGKNAVGDFYASVLSLNCKSTEEFEALKKKLEASKIPIGKYIEESLPGYAKLVFSEAGKEPLREQIKKINDFSGNAPTDSIPEIINKKEAYWEQFDFITDVFSDNFKIMSLPSNRRSDAANAIFNLSEYLAGHTGILKPEASEVIRRVFLTTDKTLSKKEKDILIKRLKKTAIPSVYENTEIALLLSLSPKKNALKLNKKTIEEEKLIRAVKAAKTNKESIINTYTVALSLRNYFCKLKKADGKKTVYDTVIKILEDIIKETSPAKEMFLSFVKSFTKSPYPSIALITVIACIIEFIVINRSIFSMLINDISCFSEGIFFTDNIKNKTISLAGMIIYPLLALSVFILLMTF